MTPEEQTQEEQTQEEPQATEAEQQETSSTELVPSLAVYPLPAIYVGQELRTKGKRPLQPGDPLTVLESDGGYVTAVAIDGSMHNLEMKGIRVYVGAPWIASHMQAAMFFARKLQEMEEERQAEAAKSKIIVPQGGVPQEVVQQMKDGRRIG